MGVYVISDGSPVVLNEPLPWPDTFVSSTRLLDGGGVDPDDLYRKQPAVRKIVDFIARNIAQLGLPGYRRQSDTDRVRLPGTHPLMQCLAEPAPKKSTYKLVDGFVHDLALWDRACLLKARDERTGKVRLYRLAPRWWRPDVDAFGNLRWIQLRRPGAAPLDLSPDVVIYVDGYAPCADGGIPPVETLRPLLVELQEGAAYRGQMWHNGARIGGWIGRPAEAPEWSEPAKNRFTAGWREQWSSDSAQAGGTPILEDGMEYHADSFEPRASEYVEGRRLTLLETATQWHVPPVMVGASEQATYSNLKEYRSMLYTETLGPVLTQLEEALDQQLVPEFDDTADVYLEFLVEAKLKGNFEEQTSALQSAVGRPWMVADEARARLNLPALGGDAAQLVTPLNVLVGGQANPRDSAPGSASRHAGTKARPTSPIPGLRDGLQRELTRIANTQRREVLRALEGKAAAPLADAYDTEHWQREYSSTLRRFAFALAAAGAAQVLADEPGWDDERMLAFITKGTEREATGIVTVTADKLGAAIASAEWRDQVAGIFDDLGGARAQQASVTATTEWANFGRHDAARFGGQRRKVWKVTSSNPRASHASLAGSVVDIGDVFGNGARWPGDSSLSSNERAGCTCRLEFTSEE